jgi:hypothetical protein
LQFPNLPAVDVGTPMQQVWFAPEDISILPDQIYARTIPDDFANYFHSQSCRQPMENRSRIDSEGLRHMPRNAQNKLVSSYLQPAINILLTTHRFIAPQLRST